MIIGLEPVSGHTGFSGAWKGVPRAHCEATEISRAFKPGQTAPGRKILVESRPGADGRIVDQPLDAIRPRWSRRKVEVTRMTPNISSCMKIQVIATKTCPGHRAVLQGELHALGISYTLQFAEDHPDLVETLSIRGSPILLREGEVIFRGLPNQSDLRAFFNLHD